MSLDQDSLVKALLSQRGTLIGYITSIVRDRHLAEDVFQDVTILALKKRESIADAGSLKKWLFKAARFEALNALRKYKRGPQILENSVLDILDGHWCARAAEGEENTALDALEQCMGRLTDKARRLVELRYMQNLSGKELSAKLARPLNTVYVALTRIHRKLADCVASRLSQEETSHGA